VSQFARQQDSPGHVPIWRSDHQDIEGLSSSQHPARCDDALRDSLIRLVWPWSLPSTTDHNVTASGLASVAESSRLWGNASLADQVADIPYKASSDSGPATRLLRHR